MTFNKAIYEKILRFLALISSVVMMTISAQFSVDGFAFQSPEKIYTGWMLAVILIVVELIFNNNPPDIEANDPMDARRAYILLIAGLVAYGYGIATNISGILHSGKMPDSPFDYIVPVALGLFIEIVPEPLMMWALLTNSRPSKSSYTPPAYKSSNSSGGSGRKFNPDILKQMQQSHKHNEERDN